jgi:hypothetical protein
MSVVPNAIGEGLRAAGHHDAADWIQANLTHPLANPATIGGMIESASPTSDAPGGHAARFVSNLVGGAAAVPASAVESAAARIVGEAPKMPIPVALRPRPRRAMFNSLATSISAELRQRTANRAFQPSFSPA